MAERLCPVCTQRPVWRTNQRHNGRHRYTRGSHNAWAADQQAQRAAQRPTREAGDA
ncbi:MAG: hypothetical protein AB7N91_14530 [Candidatus Tectimicrobiota bacterium]